MISLHLFVPRLVILALVLAATSFGTARAQVAPVELQGTTAPPAAIWLDSLDLTHAVQGFGTAQAAKSLEGHPLTLVGIEYPHGVATHAIGKMEIDLHGAATRFESVVGVDDERKGAGSVTFSVWVDGRRIQETGVLKGGDQPQLISADLTGAQRLTLLVGDAADGIKDDHADWAGALIKLVPGAAATPEMVAINEPAPRLKILDDDPTTAIQGPRVTGATPGRFFIFAIPATGTPPLDYSAQNLPAGLSLDEKTGIITGALQNAGTTRVELTVSGSGGTAQRDLTIVGGDHKLALTPPMGWNSWNVWGTSVNESRVKDAADQLISAGLAAHGYQYINIDDSWEGKRDAQGEILSNSKFPDMKALCDDIHAKGLRIGLYSSPGPKTCGGFEGSFHHEDQDAQTYAQWGFDYLKYDWCSYEIAHSDHSLANLKKPYQVMRASLDKVNRDIVFSLCQYGWGDVWKWGNNPDILGNCWRTHDDIDDLWTGINGGWGRSRGVYDIIEAEVGHEKYAGPGHWNDPDMLMVGVVGFGDTHPSRLTPNEQIVHVSMWSMFSAPLLIGCDMTKLDAFTRAILTNDEVLDIDQDPLGKPAGRISKDNNLCEVWSRQLFDGTRAVALLNGAPDEEKITVKWSDIGVSGNQPVRDLWRHEDGGAFDGSFTATVPSHGIVLLKIGSPVSSNGLH